MEIVYEHNLGESLAAKPGLVADRATDAYNRLFQ